MKDNNYINKYTSGLAIIFGVISSYLGYGYYNNYTKPENKDEEECLSPIKISTLSNLKNVNIQKYQNEDFDFYAKVVLARLPHEELSGLEKLTLYGLYKQATQGDYQGDYLNTLAFSKCKAHYKYIGTSKGSAKDLYVTFIKSLEASQYNKMALATLKQDRMSLERKEFIDNKMKLVAPQSFDVYIDKIYTKVFLDQIPFKLLVEYSEHTKIKYLLAGSGKNLSDLNALRDISPIKDNNFNDFFLTTHFSKYLYSYQELQNIDGTDIYYDLFGVQDKESYIIADLTPIVFVPVSKESGRYIAPSIVLFKNDGNTIKVASIAIKTWEYDGDMNLCTDITFDEVLRDMHLVYPEDGLCWQLSKLYCMSNAHLIMTIGLHSSLHFPLSLPIAIAAEKYMNYDSHLLRDSVIARIIKVHTFLQVAVDCNALNSETSSLWAPEKAVYTPWAHNPDENSPGMKSIMDKVLGGWDSNPLYSIINPLQIREGIGEYRKLLINQKNLINKFINDIVDNAIETNEKEMVVVNEVLTQLNKYIPENRFAVNVKNQLINEDKVSSIKTIMSFVIHNALEHSMDHAMYERDLCDNVPLRIRKEIDFRNKSVDVLEMLNTIKDVNTIVDRSVFNVSNNMFFHSHASYTLMNLINDGGYLSQDDNKVLPASNVDNDNLEILELIQDNFFDDMAKLYVSEDCPVDISVLGVSIQS
jgi:acyl-CoA-binding protein